MVWDILSSITEHITDDNSDNDSFNSAVMDLYDDVLFQYTIIPKEQVDMCSIQNRESFSSAVSVERDPSFDIPNLLPKTSELFHDGQSHYDEESVTSSHLLSAGTSNDDGLSYITDTLSAMPSTAEEDYTPNSYNALHTDLEESCTSASGVVDSVNLDYDEVIFNPSDIDDSGTTETLSPSVEYTCSDSVEYFGPSLVF